MGLMIMANVRNLTVGDKRSVFSHYLIGPTSMQLFIAKMHQKSPYSHLPKSLIANK